MTWETFVEQAQIDLVAALTGKKDGAINHILDAEINLQHAKEAYEAASEADSNGVSD